LKWTLSLSVDRGRCLGSRKLRAESAFAGKEHHVHVETRGTRAHDRGGGSSSMTPTCGWVQGRGGRGVPAAWVSTVLGRHAPGRAQWAAGFIEAKGIDSGKKTGNYCAPGLMRFVDSRCRWDMPQGPMLGRDATQIRPCQTRWSAICRPT